MQISQNIALIRQRLLQPSPEVPPDHIILNVLLEKIADHQAQLSNTRQHWSVGTTPLSVSSGQEDYPIPVTDFGRPFLVYTTDASNTYHQRREVPFTLLQDAEFRYQGPQQSQSVTHSAVEMAFFRLSPSSPQWMVRLIPIPGTTATYEIMYEAIYGDNPSLSDAPGLACFHHLIRVETAMSVLPSCGWGKIALEDDAERWEKRCTMLAQGFALDIAKYQRQFNDYKAISTRGGVNRKRGEGIEYLDDMTGGFYGVGRLTNQFGPW